MIDWKIVNVKVKELVPLERNPFGKLKKDGMKRLADKLERLGVFECAVTEHDGKTLLSFNKRHHALMALGHGEREIAVKVPTRPLTDLERREIIVASNQHEGEWVVDILKADFSDLDLSGVDIDFANDVSVVPEAAEPVYPIVPKYGESYHAVIILSDNEIDFNCLLSMLNLSTEKCYKTVRVGQSQVTTFKKFREAWDKSIS